MKKPHTFLAALALDLLLAFLIILLLLFVRDQTKLSILELQRFTPELIQLQQDLATQNLTTYDSAQAAIRINYVDQLLSRGLVLTQIALPVTIFLLTFLFSFISWRILVHVPFSRFLLVSIPAYLLAYFLTITFFQFLSAFLVGEGTASPFLLFTLLLLLFVYTYFSLLSILHAGNIKTVLTIGIRQWKRYAPWYFPFTLTFTAAVFLTILIFIFTWGNISILLPSTLLFFTLLLCNALRLKLAHTRIA